MTAEQAQPVYTIAEYSATAAAIAALREKYAGIQYEVGTKEGMELAKTGHKELRGLRTALENKRKEIKAPALERARLIDDEAKRITAALVELEDPIAKQIKIEEDRVAAEKAAAELAERCRVDGLRNTIAMMRGAANALLGKPASEVQAELDLLKANPIGDKFAEFKGEATDVHALAISQLEKLLVDRRAHETEQAQMAKDREELARMKAADEERRAADKVEEERQVAIKRAAQETIDRQHREKQEAETKRLDDEIAAKRAVQQQLDDEAAAKRKAEQEAHEKAMAEERAKLAEQARLQADAEARETAKRKAQEEADAAAETRVRNAAPVLVDSLLRLALMPETTPAQRSIIDTALKAAGIKAKEPEKLAQAA